MALLTRIFGGDSRFLLGYSVPGNTANQDIEPMLLRAVRLWDVRAVKVHPPLSGIDLCASSGRLRLEAILAAADRAALPGILHGGASPNGGESSGQSFGMLENLGDIDFNVTRHPVVIAHAGAFGLGWQQVESEVLPGLDRLLGQHEHLYVDISALTAEITGLLVSRIESQRMVFGSDALYELPWKSLVKLFVALENAPNGQPEERLIRMAATNPDLLLGKLNSDETHPSHQAGVGMVSMPRPASL